MNPEEIDKISKTLLVILKARNQPSEIALLGLVSRWQPEEVESNNSYEQDRLWELKLFLPAEVYAGLSADVFSESSKVIESTLNEIVRAQRDRFVYINFFPELVDHLTFTQKQLIEWLEEARERGLIRA